MATRTITRLFDTHADATDAVTRLEAAGVPHSDISLVGGHPATGTAADTTGEAAPAAGTGATIGTVIGGGAGLLAGLGSRAIPGSGPGVAAGWLIATLTGAGVGAAVGGGAGGLVGALTGAGVSEDDAHVYAESVRRGGTLVTVRADETNAAMIEQTLHVNAVDPVARRADYQSGGWSSFDDTTVRPADPALGETSIPRSTSTTTGSGI